MSEEAVPKIAIEEFRRKMAGIVRKELLQVGELREVEEKLKIVVEMTSKFVPLPEGE